MSIQCRDCGVATEFREHFHEVRRSFSRRKVFYCPLCWAKRHQRSFRLGFLACVVVCLVNTFLVVKAPEDGVQSILSWITLNIFLGCLFHFLHILPHELGHALMARLLGWRVFTIALGEGRNLCRFTLGRTLFEINTIPTIGITRASTPSASYYRVKWFLFVLAGPLTDALLLGGALLLVPVPLLLAPLPGTNLYPGITWIVVCLLGLVGDLFPFHIKATLGSVVKKISSDGLGLAKAFFLSAEEIRQRQAIYYFLEGHHSYLQHDYRAARQWLEQGLELHPEDIPVRVEFAFVLLFVHEFHAARAQWLHLLEREHLPAAFRTLIVNNLAWTDLVIGGEELLAEADRLSQQAVEEYAWWPPIQGTRGSVLIDLGEAEKGLPLVRLAFEANEDPCLKALNACYLALGEYRRGNHREAQRQRDAAQKLDPKCMLLKRVEQTLAAAGAEREDRVNP